MTNVLSEKSITKVTHMDNTADISTLPIGVFDSGMGGLTVLRALRHRLPQESFIYLGDTARLPYGTKSKSTVEQYAMQMMRVLVERKIKAAVIACNTATTAALPHVRAMMPDLPIIGVVEPGASAAVASTKTKRIAVLATETTIASKAYQRVITEQCPDAFVTGRACSVLVALAEEGLVEHAVTKEALLYYLAGINNVDTVLLGCTHFPVFKPLLATLLPKQINIVDSAEATATALLQCLMERQLFRALKATPFVHYLVTDSVARFQAVGEVFLGETLDKSTIELIDSV